MLTSDHTAVWTRFQPLSYTLQNALHKERVIGDLRAVHSDFSIQMLDGKLARVVNRPPLTRPRPQLSLTPIEPSILSSPAVPSSILVSTPSSKPSWHSTTIPTTNLPRPLK